MLDYAREIEVECINIDIDIDAIPEFISQS